MRLIGLKIDRMDPSIQKVLKQGWYPFGDYSEPKADGYLCVESISRVEKSLYRLRHEQPEVSVSCVVGMNGSGKSGERGIRARPEGALSQSGATERT